jgi:hypothetical protein
VGSAFVEGVLREHKCFVHHRLFAHGTFLTVFFCEAQERLTTRVSSLTKVIVYTLQGQFTARLGNSIIYFILRNKFLFLSRIEAVKVKM